ncbi:hypothetical protein [Thermoleptolyngbya sp. C42_A2020_037]|uniref:hypothetical protein n=1 Tax=Thermoleptolyngbya sp. C42_A2020_037 TaxID=2747799 RepID=UPI0019EDF7CB|nr:hypothetical protein [Thermoleptolyngbya sp. C42_A2020_037]MBF2083065.1 hypothetical protein [Thermoleptolyngbya sp. C42_A2020_037]
MISTQSQTSFRFVEEDHEPFLSLFPHRYDYIWAEHSPLATSGKLAWRTESRHPLSDRLILQGRAFYGVRFGAETRYCLLDIDANSSYHPGCDPFAISRLVAALEPLGLVSFVACTSSYSGGIHLYFPFDQPVKTWQLAIALQFALESAGFCIALGQLEIFPNPKLYVSGGEPSLYAAHRLPLQLGSYLLDTDWQPIYSTRRLFVERWQFAVARNAVSSQVVEHYAKSARRQRHGLSGKADKFLGDLSAEIEPGWTGYGQTNYLLGRIALRTYIFGHLLYGTRPLEGKPLVDTIVRVARSLPGYGQWCRHQHEIEKRAEEWARCVENSHYFHFQRSQRRLKSLSEDAPPGSPTWNQQQQEVVREKIRRAIADLLNRNHLPVTTTARFKALIAYGISGASLYRHRDLWHPNDLIHSSQVLENFAAFQGTEGDASTTQSPSVYPTSLLAQGGCNGLAEGHSSSFVESEKAGLGCNYCKASESSAESLAESSTGIETAEPRQVPPETLTDVANASDVNASDVNASDVNASDVNASDVNASDAISGIRYVQRVLRAIATRARQQPAHLHDVAVQYDQARRSAQQAAFAARMQTYLASGDPILMREAIAWMQARSPSPHP